MNHNGVIIFGFNKKDIKNTLKCLNHLTDKFEIYSGMNLGMYSGMIHVNVTGNSITYK